MQASGSTLLGEFATTLSSRLEGAGTFRSRYAINKVPPLNEWESLGELALKVLKKDTFCIIRTMTTPRFNDPIFPACCQTV